MALKTFNIDGETYKEFSKHCKKNGISMRKMALEKLKAGIIG